MLSFLSVTNQGESATKRIDIRTEQCSSICEFGTAESTCHSLRKLPSFQEIISQTDDDRPRVKARTADPLRCHSGGTPAGTKGC